MFHVGIYQVEVGDFLRENLEQGSFPDNVLKSQNASFIQDHSELERAWIFQASGCNEGARALYRY